MKVCIRTISSRAKTKSYLYYGKEAIGEYNGKPKYSSLDAKDVVPYDLEDTSDLKRLISKLDTFEHSGYNTEVKLFWILNDGTLKRVVEPKEFQTICKRNLKFES